MAGKDNSAFHEAESQILSRLNIEQVYSDFGLKWAGSGVTASGWRDCHAFDREDRNPSARVFVGDGPGRGRYRDYGDGIGQSVGLFDFACDYANQFPDWRSARKAFADQVGVKIPTAGEGKRPQDAFKWLKHDRALLRMFCRYRPGISPDAVVRTGSLPADWNRQHVYAWPSFTHQLFDVDPCGYHLMGDFGRKIRIDEKTFVKTVQKGKPGLLGLWGLQHLETADVIWWTEGISDLLALQTVLRDRVDHVAICMGGISYQPTDEIAALIAGKSLNIVFDADPPSSKYPAGQGMVGAVTLLQKLVPFAKEVRNVRLPQPDLTKKIDLRDFLLDGNSFEDLLALTNSFSPVNQIDISRQAEQLKKKNCVTNYVSIPQSNGTAAVEPIPALVILKSMKDMTGNWPRTVAGELFYIKEPDPKSGVKKVIWLHSSASLFGYFHKVGAVDWQANQTECITKGEYYQLCVTDSDASESIENHPHFPSVQGAHYLRQPLELGKPFEFTGRDGSTKQAKTGDGTAINEFLSFFNPSDFVVDGTLLKACVCTMYWGGPNGQRPAFLFTAKAGRGVGKTTTAQMIASLVGGAFRFGKTESIETINKRLLTSEAMVKRICLVDNIKSQKFGWADFESLVTSDYISGHKLYKGEAQRANLLTWFLTLNGPSLSTDIAQRVAIVELARRHGQNGEKNERDWVGEVQDFIAEYGDSISADVEAILSADIKPSTAKGLRWTAWKDGVLSKVCDSTDHLDSVIKALLARQGEADEEKSLAANILEEIASNVAHYNSGAKPIAVNAAMIYRWLTKVEEQLGLGIGSEPSFTKMLGRLEADGAFEGDLIRHVGTIPIEDDKVCGTKKANVYFFCQGKSCGTDRLRISKLAYVGPYWLHIEEERKRNEAARQKMKSPYFSDHDREMQM